MSKDERKENYRIKYGITPNQAKKRLTESFMDQLDRCASDEIRRLLIFGKSR